MESTCDIVILASGSSSRLGSPKQLLLYKEVTLLQHSIEQALAAAARSVIVVVREKEGWLPKSLQHEKLAVVINTEWHEGMAASIRSGIKCLLQKGNVTGQVLFMVCDQPYVNSDLLNKLITLQKETGNGIVASEYASVRGIPAIFTSEFFPDLLSLTGDSGAKKIIMQYADRVATVSFPFGEIDIDTASDYEQLKSME